MDSAEFRRHGHELIDWIAGYLDDPGEYPVLAQVSPGEVRNRLPGEPPQQGESMADILADFHDVIMPGVTHWNHPRFFAYFPANNSGPSVLGELLSAGLGVNAMLWQTCPAATELEEVVMDWLRQLLGLPSSFKGVIQDTASTATLCALVCARERTTGGGVNRRGFAAGVDGGPLRIYASGECHSSIEKGARIAGFGSENLVRVGTTADFALDPDDLERLVEADVAAGMRPCAVVATVGTTSSTALDPLPAVAGIARRHGLWLHVDAALAGSAAILPEKQSIIAGAEEADSFVFNPHKWLFTNFDCSAFFTRRPDELESAMSIDPEYLKTDRDPEVTNFRDWGIQLGRRFRALKLWFVLRRYGAEGLREMLRSHIEMAGEFAEWVRRSDDFEMMAPAPLNTVCFRCTAGGGGEADLDRFNKTLLDAVNATGLIYITHTRLDGKYALRLSVGQIGTRRRHVEEAWKCLRETAARLAAA